MKRILILLKNWILYSQRVLADLGIIKNNDSVRAYYKICEQNGMLNNIKFAWFGDSGSKYRTSGIYTYFTKLYSLFSTNDAVQATELNQPYLTGNIAPNERYAMYNPNGASRYVAHPAFNFSATDPWSLTMLFNWNGQGVSHPWIVSGGTNTKIGIYYSTGMMFVNNESNTNIAFTVESLYKNIGQATYLTLTAAGDGTIKVYKNGVYMGTMTIASNITLNSIMTIGQVFACKYFTHVIRSGALTASQVAAEYSFFRSIYPEIPTVQIGTQEWTTSNLDMVCTPQGNVINEITGNANVPDGTFDGSFTSSTGWTLGAGHTISGGALNINSGPDNTFSYNSTGVLSKIIGKYYKITYTISNYVAGSIAVYSGGANRVNNGANGTFTTFIKCTTTESNIYVFANGTTQLTVDNVSVQLVGWSGLTEVYDAVYAATAGAAAVKDQAGCLAAAAWCHYNNDNANGAIYGKLYNDYATALIAKDIAMYNAANPSAPWGYDVPINTQLTTLQTTLGGSTVAGGKVKKDGIVYWTTPNTGADNSSGYTALPAGYRDAVGVFRGINTIAYYGKKDNYEDMRVGKSLRLIKV